MCRCAAKRGDAGKFIKIKEMFGIWRTGRQRKNSQNGKPQEGG
jgi:hypothetical protein